MALSRAFLIAPLLVLALAGCVPTVIADPATSPSPEPGKPTGLPTPTDSAAATPSPRTEPVTLGCSDVLTPQAIYDYNPNVGLLADFTPEQGTLAGDAVGQQGLACRLLNQSSGETIDIGLVAFIGGAFAEQEASVSASASATTTFDGFFDVEGTTGIAQAFSDPYWITFSSKAFLEDQDAADLVTAALDNLG